MEGHFFNFENNVMRCVVVAVCRIVAKYLFVVVVLFELKQKTKQNKTKKMGSRKEEENKRRRQKIFTKRIHNIHTDSYRCRLLSSSSSSSSILLFSSFRPSNCIPAHSVAHTLVKR